MALRSMVESEEEDGHEGLSKNQASETILEIFVHKNTFNFLF